MRSSLAPPPSGSRGREVAPWRKRHQRIGNVGHTADIGRVAASPGWGRRGNGLLAAPLQRSRSAPLRAAVRKPIASTQSLEQRMAQDPAGQAASQVFCAPFLLRRAARSWAMTCAAVGPGTGRQVCPWRRSRIVTGLSEYGVAAEEFSALRARLEECVRTVTGST